MHNKENGNGQERSDDGQLDEIERRVHEIRQVIRGTEDQGVSEDETEAQPDETGRLTRQNLTEPDETRHPAEANATKPDETRHLDMTKPDETRQNPTISENGVRSFFDELSTRQQAAIRHLIDGASITDTAERVDVARQTVSGWLNRSFPFEMALREKLREVWGETNVGMAAHARKAIGRLADLLDSSSAEYRVKAARSILALTPLARNRGVTGPYMP